MNERKPQLRDVAVDGLANPLPGSEADAVDALGAVRDQRDAVVDVGGEVGQDVDVLLAPGRLVLLLLHGVDLDRVRQQAAGALLLGRVTYDAYASAWPSIEDEAGFAEKMNGMPKYVVSRPN